MKVLQRKKCQTQFFLVCILPYLNWIRRYIPVFSPNTEKYGPEKTIYFDIFCAMFIWHVVISEVTPFKNFGYRLMILLNQDTLKSVFKNFFKEIYKITSVNRQIIGPQLFSGPLTIVNEKSNKKWHSFLWISVHIVWLE